MRVSKSSYLDETKILSLTKGELSYKLNFYRLLAKLLIKSIEDISGFNSSEIIGFPELKKNYHKLKPNIKLFCNDSVYQFFLTLELKIKEETINQGDISDLCELLKNILLEIQQNTENLSTNK